MKYAVIGTGKTGHAILNILPQNDVVAACNTHNPVTAEQLKEADIGIVFVPGNALGSLLPLLLESKLPMVIGTTGYAWPPDLDLQLKNRNVSWIIGQNFSLGLNVMRYFSAQIKESLNALKPKQLRLGITEKHHIHKLDSPSGTALHLAQVLGIASQEILSIREGDAKGTHTVSFDWLYDRIALTHEALDRSAFAEGVVVACTHISQLTAGLHYFEDLADELIEIGTKG